MARYDDDNRHMLDEIEEEEQREKEKKPFNLFGFMYRDGDGVDEDEEKIGDNPSLKNFFVLVWRKLNTIFTLNLLLVVCNIPIFFFLFALAGYLSYHTTSPYYTMAAPILGIAKFDHSATISALYTIFCRNASVTVLSVADKVLLGLGLLTLLTYGPSRVGLTYIFRNILRGEPVFMWDDFKHAVSRNIKQALIYGVMDIAIFALLIYDIVFFNLNYGISMMTDIMFFLSLALVVMYFFMRMYIYLMIVTFDLSLFKMFKNALYFTVLGVKRNVMALLGTLFLFGIEFVVLRIFFPLGVILPFIIIPSMAILISVYAAFPKIKEIMIDPYYRKTKAQYSEDTEE